MYLGKVIGSVVATKKDEAMKGHKLLMVRPLLVDENKPSQLNPSSNTIICVDTLGAGEGELVMLAQGGSARKAEGLGPLPIDAAIIGLVDAVNILGEQAYKVNNS